MYLHPSNNTKENALGIYKAWNKVPFVGKCVGCYYDIENHDHWCTAKESSSEAAESFKKKGIPIKGREQLEQMLEANATLTQSRVEAEAHEAEQKQKRAAGEETATELELDSPGVKRGRF